MKKDLKLPISIIIAAIIIAGAIYYSSTSEYRNALKASNISTKEILIIESKIEPSRVPPEPILSISVKIRLIYERFKALSEI